jgi:hypothetical protein
MLLTLEIIACLFRAVLPAIDAWATLLIVIVISFKVITIPEVNLALTMSTSSKPLPFEDAAVKEESTMALAPVILPLSIVDRTIFATHDAEAFFLSHVVEKALVDLAIRKLWRLSLSC